MKGFNNYLRTQGDPDSQLSHPFDDPNFGEALRSLDVEFKILAVGKPPENYPYPERPPIHFRGRIILAHDDEMNEIEAPNANMLGTVSMTTDGEIRWSFVSDLLSKVSSSMLIQQKTSGEDGHVVWR